MTTTQRNRSPLVLGAAVLALAGACAPPAAPDPSAGPADAAPPATARDFVERMRQHYEGRFYRSMTFRQENVAYTSAGEQRSAWLERQVVPGLLRIDFVEPVADGSGILFRADSAYSFQNGRLAQAVPQPHLLLLLAADVYALPAERTMAKLDALDVDTTELRADSWQGRDVWVVGAPAGDTSSTQFWVDAERMLVSRLFHRQEAPGGRAPRTTEYRFEYQEVGGVPVPREVLFLRDGRPFFRETYVDPRLDVPIADSVFVPERWSETLPPN